MLTLTNFTLYTPEQVLADGISYLQDEDGNDWYEAQQNFQEDTLKVRFNAQGVITSMSMDVSALWPVNQSVTEVAVADVPDGVDISGGWTFDGEKITARVYTPEELAEQAAAEKAQRIAAALQVIIPLQIMVKRDMATDADKAQLEAWEEYSVLLNRVDTAKAGKVKWPKIPAGMR